MDRPAPIVICSPASFTAFFPDDLFDVCALCQTPVRHRPHIPARRFLICLLCFLKHAKPGDRCAVLNEAVAELELIGITVPPC